MEEYVLIGMISWFATEILFQTISLLHFKKQYYKQKKFTDSIILRVKQQEEGLNKAYLNIDEKLKNLKETDQTYDA